MSLFVVAEGSDNQDNYNLLWASLYELAPGCCVGQLREEGKESVTVEKAGGGGGGGRDSWSPIRPVIALRVAVVSANLLASLLLPYASRVKDEADVVTT